MDLGLFQHRLAHFNSQPHEEADLWQKCIPELLMHFNSQPHEEADMEELFEVLACGISTHSLTKRLTLSVAEIADLLLYFNSQPHEEADNIDSHPLCREKLFQLTASRRG